jgi:hypothetical protein
MASSSALWRIVFTRMATDPHTMAYVTRRTTEGKTTREIIRCLKRYVAREVYKTLTAWCRAGRGWRVPVSRDFLTGHPSLLR